MHDAAQGMWQREADSICFASKQMLSGWGASPVRALLVIFPAVT